MSKPRLLLTSLLVLGSRLGQSAPQTPLQSLPDSAALGVFIPPPERAVAYSFANDAPFRTDYYFTQGMRLTVVLPAFGRLPTRRLLGGPAPAATYGLRLRYDGFTPLRIQDAFIRRGDRPYASYIYATLFRARTDAAGRARLTTGVQVGIIGPAVGAKGFQTAVHRWLDAPTPRGWDFQIRNDVVLGYEVGAERQLLTVGRGLEAVATARAALSTLRTVASAGAAVRVGLFDPYFSSLLGVTGGWRGRALRPVQLYLEGHAEGQLVGYDATMQGGVFNQTSVYTLSAGAVRRAVGQASGALVAAVGAVSGRVAACWTTPEIRAGRAHAWGQMEVRVGF